MADTLILGGRGTMADASDDNGGGHTGSVAWADVMGANSAPLYTVTGAAYADATGIITKAGEFAVGLTGVLVHTKEGAAGAWVEDWYAITASDANTITIASGLGDNVDIDVWVGGAFAQNGTGLATALALFAAASGDKIQVASNPASATVYPVAATITVPAVAGTSALKFIIKGVDYSDGSDLSLTDDRPEFQAVAGLGATPILLLDNGATEYYKWSDIVFDGMDIANYCVYNSVLGTDYQCFEHCRFRQATDYGFRWHSTSYYLKLIKCDADNNGSYGFYFSNHVLAEGCFAYANPGGFLVGGTAVLNDCISYGNSAIGFYLTSRSVLNNCISYDNGSDGVYCAADVYWISIANCSMFGNGGYGIDLNGVTTSLVYLSNNHSHNNTSGHYSEGVDNTWADAFGGDNIDGDPEMVDPANADFTMKYSSPLLRAGIGNTDIGASGRLAGWGIGYSPNGGFA